MSLVYHCVQATPGPLSCLSSLRCRRRLTQTVGRYERTQAGKRKTKTKKKTRICIFGIVGGLAVLGVILILFEAKPRPSPLINGERLANAMARYTTDLHSRGEALPRTVTLDTLVGQGYLSAEDTKPLQGVELVFHTDAVDTNPQMLLGEAHMPDGQVQAVLADGSVQQFSRSRWAEVQRNVGQQDGAASRSQPVRPESNSTSAAAGSGR